MRTTAANVQREHKPYEHMPKGNYIRKLLWETVLATDMSVHDEFMARLQLEVDSSSSDASKTGGAPTNISVHPMFQDRATDDVAEDGLVIWKRKILTCQSIIKCADISNPVRIPSYISVSLETDRHVRPALSTYRCTGLLRF